MNIVLYDVSYKLVQSGRAADFVSYEVYKGESKIGSITKGGAEIYYTAADMQGNVRGCAATLRETIEAMVLDMFYRSEFTKGRRIVTHGAWCEGEKVKVEFVRGDFVKYGERVVHYSKDAGDLFITIDNNKYFYCEFE